MRYFENDGDVTESLTPYQHLVMWAGWSVGSAWTGLLIVKDTLKKSQEWRSRITAIGFILVCFIAWMLLLEATTK